MRLPYSLLAYCLTTISPCLAVPMADWASVRIHSSQRKDHSGVDSKSPEKYFHEATFHPHYDGRFAEKPLPYKEKLDHLKPLIQTYLSTMNDIGAETWIMHGTLIGWYWNRKIMPWDSDADVMMSEQSIEHLANYYNMTVHHYKVPGVPEGRNYMLEINPRWLNATTADKHNVIDGRWVDTTSGLFIDITTLRVNRTALEEGIEAPMWCKDKHHYMYDDIFPLRESTFEGVPVKIPFAYAELIEEEYGEKAITRVEYEHHYFDTETKEWIPQKCEDRGDCPASVSSSEKKRPEQNKNNGVKTTGHKFDKLGQDGDMSPKAKEFLYNLFPDRRPGATSGRVIKNS